jgi:ANTAR domain
VAGLVRAPVRIGVADHVGGVRRCSQSDRVGRGRSDVREDRVELLELQLYVEKDNLGALNLYSYRPDAFDDESEHVGLMFASPAAVAFADAQRIDQLNHKAATRDLIGQAQGILMERYNIS